MAWTNDFFARECVYLRSNELSVPSKACESRVSMAFESESVLFLFVSALFLFYGALSHRRPTLSRASRARFGNGRLLQGRALITLTSFGGNKLC